MEWSLEVTLITLFHLGGRLGPDMVSWRDSWDSLKTTTSPPQLIATLSIVVS